MEVGGTVRIRGREEHESLGAGRVGVGGGCRQGAVSSVQTVYLADTLGTRAEVYIEDTAYSLTWIYVCIVCMLCNDSMPMCMSLHNCASVTSVGHLYRPNKCPGPWAVARLETCGQTSCAKRMQWAMCLSAVPTKLYVSFVGTPAGPIRTDALSCVPKYAPLCAYI